MHRLLSLPTVAAAALLVVGGMFAPAAAQASSDDLQERVDQVLAAYPGGEQTGPGEITWDDGAVVLTLLPGTADSALARGVGSCADGTFCAFSGSSLSGARISFTSCSGANSVAPLGSPVRSIANARSSGVVVAYNGSSAVASVGAGAWTNTSATITRLGC